MSKCIFTVITPGWFPELCELTVPLMQRWANRIGADFRIISDTKFPGWPPNYERLQVHELGKEYSWNIVMDADYIFDVENIEDPTFNRDPSIVYIEGGMVASYYFTQHAYLIRDGRNQGVGDSLVVSSTYTHDIWTPLDMTYDEASKYCIRNLRQVSELCLTLNLARYGLKFDGVINDKSQMFHLAATGLNRDRNETLQLARQKMKEFGLS